MVNLFLKGFIIGIGKIIPGVSGAMIAVSFGIYDRLINAVTNFFDDKKNNFKFLLLVGSGILLSIVCFSGFIRYLINNYYLITMMFFLGLIVGGTYSFSKKINYTLKNILIIIGIVLLVIFLGIGNINNNYFLSGNYMDCVMFFYGGVIEIFSSLVPGISGTALLMLIGIYDNILLMFSNMFNISFVFNNIGIYISYGIGMMVSFIVCCILISYLLKKYRSLFDTIIFSLSIASIILLLIMTFSNGFGFTDVILGIILFFFGIIISYLFDK